MPNLVAITIRTFGAIIGFLLLAFLANFLSEEGFIAYIYIQTVIMFINGVFNMSVLNFTWQQLNLAEDQAGEVSELLKGSRLVFALTALLGATIFIIFLSFKIGILFASLFSVIIFIYQEIHIDLGLLKGKKKFIFSELLGLIAQKTLIIFSFYIFANESISYIETLYIFLFSASILFFLCRIIRIYIIGKLSFSFPLLSLKHLNRMVNFSIGQLAGNSVNKLPILFLNIIGNGQASAIYSIFQTLLQSSTLLVNTIYDRLRASISDFTKQRKFNDLEAFLKPKIQSVFAINAIFSLMLLIISPPLIEMLFPAHLTVLKNYIFLVCIAIMSLSVLGPVGQIYICLNEEGVLARMNLVLAFIFLPSSFFILSFFGINEGLSFLIIFKIIATLFMCLRLHKQFYVKSNIFF